MKYDTERKEAYAKVFKIMANIYEHAGYEAFNNIDSIKYRIKSESSILGKMASKKVGSNIEDVYDLIGLRYIFKELKDCEALRKSIMNNEYFKIVEIKDYLNGHPEDPDYKAIHFRAKFEGYPCEIELLDLEMEEHVAKTHEAYKNGLLIPDKK